MARFNVDTTPADPVQHYLQGVAKYLVQRLYGNQGPAWGTQLCDIEDTILAIRQVLSQKMLDEALQRQADTACQRPAAWQSCPKCGQQVQDRPPRDDEDPRVLLTRVGQAQWHEPHSACRKCRRAFFPSDQEFGD